MRQEKALEELFKAVIRQAGLTVAVNAEQARTMISEVICGYDSKLDLDVVARRADGNVLALQLRSRDDTGGTTAKSSLVEALRQAMELPASGTSHLFYLVGIWEGRNGSQKKTTINKFYDSLKPHLPDGITKAVFRSRIGRGIAVGNRITLRLSYGKDAIIKTISGWMGQEVTHHHQSMSEIIQILERVDDLWLAYTIASLELGAMKVRGFNNIQYLNGLLGDKDLGCTKLTHSREYVEVANQLATQIIPVWAKDSLPVSTPAEQANYIRDLILMRLVYDFS